MSAPDQYPAIPLNGNRPHNDWSYQRALRGLPTTDPPPRGVETFAEWMERLGKMDYEDWERLFSLKVTEADKEAIKRERRVVEDVLRDAVKPSALNGNSSTGMAMIEAARRDAERLCRPGENRPNWSGASAWSRMQIPSKEEVLRGVNNSPHRQAFAEALQKQWAARTEPPSLGERFAPSYAWLLQAGKGLLKRLSRFIPVVGAVAGPAVIGGLALSEGATPAEAAIAAIPGAVAAKAGRNLEAHYERIEAGLPFGIGHVGTQPVRFGNDIVKAAGFSGADLDPSIIAPVVEAVGALVSPQQPSKSVPKP